jgi:hypothetical protein
MSTWILPEGSTEIDDVQDGDLIARSEGDELFVARVVGDSVEWLGGAPIDTIVLPDVDEPTQAPDDLTDALEGFAAALAARGG